MHTIVNRRFDFLGFEMTFPFYLDTCSNFYLQYHHHHIVFWGVQVA
jgi:hypothetical protein